MGTVTPNFRELYDWLKENRPEYLEWCKDYARCHCCTIGAVVTWKEDEIRGMMKTMKNNCPMISTCGVCNPNCSEYIKTNTLTKLENDWWNYGKDNC